jgi:ribokinase
MSVIVFGSINLDLVARTSRIPGAGETVTGRSFITQPGGKGANQAVAVARLGVSTHMVGRVSGDPFGQELLASLATSQVNCERVLVDQATPSGVAVITVEDSGENTIVVVPGANGQVGAADVERLLDLLPTAKVLLLQLEVPLPAVMQAAAAAKQAGVTVILDPAPARADLPSELYSLIDIITPNQTEAEQLVRFPVIDLATAKTAAQTLHERGIATVIIKLGKQGAFCLTTASPPESPEFEIPAFSVTAVDTVAAGDAFNGGLAAGLAVGMSLQSAARQAAAVAALAVTKMGAQPSLPTRAELDAFLAEQAT